MIEIQKCFDTFESLQFSTELNLLGNINAMGSFIENHPAFKLIVGLDRRLVDYKVCERIMSLSGLEVDLKFQNPYDEALAVYLKILDQIESRALALMSEKVSRTANLWLAKKYSFAVLFKEKSDVISSNSTEVLLATNSTYDRVTDLSSADGTKSIFISGAFIVPEKTAVLSGAELNFENPAKKVSGVGGVVTTELISDFLNPSSN